MLSGEPIPSPYLSAVGFVNDSESCIVPRKKLTPGFIHLIQRMCEDPPLIHLCLSLIGIWADPTPLPQHKASRGKRAVNKLPRSCARNLILYFLLLHPVKMLWHLPCYSSSGLWCGCDAADSGGGLTSKEVRDLGSFPYFFPKEQKEEVHEVC